MLIRSLEIMCAVMSLVCAAILSVSFLVDVKRKFVPTLVAIGGGITYAIFLALSGLATHWEFLPMLFAFVVSAFITSGNYRQLKQKKVRSKEKFEEFKRECIEARSGVYVA